MDHQYHHHPCTCTCNGEDCDSVAASHDHDQDHDQDHDNDSQSYCSAQWQHDPIVVGYAFMAKKMKSMSVVMAEASRVPVIHEEVEEFTAFPKGGNEPQDSSHTSTSETPLTKAALRDLERGAVGTGTQQSSTIITVGNSNETDLKHIVRYFQSSCSSAGSMSETTVSTPTTTTTFNSSKRSQSQSQSQSHRLTPVRISFVPLDPDVPLEEQHEGRFDLILHKLTEDILTCSLDDKNKEASLHRVQSLKRYQELINPECCLVDDPAHVQTLMSRADIAQVLETCLRNVHSLSGIPVRAPKFVVVEASNRPPDAAMLQRKLRAKGLSAPLIVKPLVAAGTKESHFMTVLLKDSALSKLTSRSIIQEYVNHNATLYKVYILGDHAYVYERPSLPNLPPTEQLETAVDSLEFDSQRPYPKIQDFGIDAGSTGEKGQKQQACTHKRTVPVTSDEVRPIVESLRHAFGLELFGFDILLSHESNEWLVVDVNVS
jgi:inositol-1,3,4-trisphosphate 5/6-kinase/inositol-tetrakisphosphate 1-kinase